MKYKVLGKDEILVKSPAKINLTLEVLNKRSDDYHNLRSVIIKIDLFDEVLVKISPSIRNTIKISSNISSIQGRKNNCFKVVEVFINAYSEKINSSFDYEIKIKKKIPLSSGLGGSSTNIAAVVFALNKIHNLKINKSDLCRFVSNFGSDSALFFKKGLVLLEEKGQKIREINNSFFEFSLLIIEPNFKTTANEIYNRYKLLINKNERSDLSADMIKQAKKKDLMGICSYLYNDLEMNYKQTGKIVLLKSLLKSLGSIGVLMSGSGSCVYGIFKNRKKALDAYKNLKKISNNVRFKNLIENVIMTKSIS